MKKIYECSVAKVELDDNGNRVIIVKDPKGVSNVPCKEQEKGCKCFIYKTDEELENV